MNKFSVIMTVYDQAQELEKQLPAYLKQTYEPGYEVIVVDESSTDETPDVLKRLKNEYPHLYSTFLPKPNRRIVRRKQAFNVGIKAAKNEWIIIAKINRAPSTNDLLKAINDIFDDYAAITLGYIEKKGVRLQPFATVDEAANRITKTERKLTKVVARDARVSYWWGRYDIIILPKKNLIDMLQYFEQKVSSFKLLFMRLGILNDSIWRRGSTTLLVAVVKGKDVTVDSVNAAMKAQASESFGYNTDPIVSSDVIGMTYGSLFDATQTMVAKIDDDTYQVQVVSWYDNENSYTSQMVRTIKYFAELK